MSKENFFLIIQSMTHPFSSTIISGIENDDHTLFGMGAALKKSRLTNLQNDRPDIASTKIAETNQNKLIVVSPVFKLVFLSVFFITMFSGIVAIMIAFMFKTDNANQQVIFESMNTVWKLGIGAMFGLLSGKAT